MNSFAYLLLTIGVSTAIHSVSNRAAPNGALEDGDESVVPPDGAYAENGRAQRSAVTDTPDDNEICGVTDVDAPGYVLGKGPNPDADKESPDTSYNTDDDPNNKKRRKRQSSCSGKYSQTDRNAILKYHNDMRSSIARGRYVAKGSTKQPAVNMRKMYYSCDMERSAQQVANRCLFQHSDRSGKNTGENLYQYMMQRQWAPKPLSTNGTGYDACKAWESEFQTIGWPSNTLTSSSFGTGIGHATQMAWWQTTLVGCGVAQCSDNTYQKVLVVCHYQDAGNWIGENIYDAGPTCSKCGTGYRCDSSTGLCIV
ncbi:hypothetical protein Q1695_000201 [Nippostrongylus brasiliensis]|nr:hypothetical protein Q1695_000201 [Nippostrongylus brasiliensis]